MEPFNQRQGFLVSAIVHLMLLMILVNRPPSRHPFDTPRAEPPDKKEIVFLPPPEVLRRLLPPQRRSPQPVPTPAPPARERAKDRISIGPPADQRQKGPLILRREDDLTAVPKGERGHAPPQVAPSPVAPPPPVTPRQQAGGAPQVAGREGLRLPPGLGPYPGGEEGSRGRPGDEGPSIASSLRNLERRLEQTPRQGLPTGSGQQMGPLFFDPEGADFTAWIQRFKDEVYRNWNVPEPARWGARGHVDFEFTVERNGSMTNLRLLKSSGTVALDRAAEKALEGSRFLPLPSDYGPPRVTMQVSFFYNEGPQGS